MTDTEIIDRIATLLGTTEDWSGADCLSDISNLIGLVRPNPGAFGPNEYADLFEKTTGREVVPAWDAREF